MLGLWIWRLVKLQKEAVRIIHRAKYNAHSEPLLKKSGLIALKDIFDFQRCKFYYKFKDNLLPDYFTIFTLNNQNHNHDTRSSADLHRFPVTKATQTRVDITFLVCLIAGPPKLKTDSIHTTLLFFSHGYKLSLLNKYSSECRLRNCYICELMRLRN